MSDDWALERLYHTVINAKNIDETVAFYEALGFVIVRDRRQMKWPPDAGLRWGLIPSTGLAVVMALPADPPPDGPMLDIIQWVNPTATFPETSPTTVPRILAFRARNVQGVMRAMQAKGYRTTTQDATDAHAAAGMLALGGIYDPNGNVIELVELAEGLTTSRLQEVYGTKSA